MSWFACARRCWRRFLARQRADALTHYQARRQTLNDYDDTHAW